MTTSKLTMKVLHDRGDDSGPDIVEVARGTVDELKALSGVRDRWMDMPAMPGINGGRGWQVNWTNLSAQLALEFVISEV